MELASTLRRLGVRTRVTRLDFGDACFHGNGPDDEYIIGVERKCLSDALNSMQSRRLVGFQLPGMLDTFHRSIVLIEGIWSPGKNGELCVYRRGEWVPVELGSRRFLYSELDNFMTSLEETTPTPGQVHVRRTSNSLETAVVLSDLVHWWAKPWKDHKSLRQAYIRTPEPRRSGLAIKIPGIVWKMAAQIPKIDQKGELVERKFKTPLEMCQADATTWQEIDGIGPTIAENAVHLLQGRKNG